MRNGSIYLPVLEEVIYVFRYVDEYISLCTTRVLLVFQATIVEQHGSYKGLKERYLINVGKQLSKLGPSIAKASLEGYQHSRDRNLLWTPCTENLFWMLYKEILLIT